MTCQGYKFLSLTEMCHPSANVYDDHIEGSYRPSGMTGTAYGVISVRVWMDPVLQGFFVSFPMAELTRLHYDYPFAYAPS